MALDYNTETTSYGGPKTEVYADFTYVQSFIENNKLEYSAWTDATSLMREAAIRQATRDIDAKCYWGAKWYWNQRLEFPRADDVWPHNEITWDPTNYPHLAWQEENVKKACSEQTLFLLGNSGKSTHLERQRQGIRSFSQSGGRTSQSFAYGGSSSRLCPEAVQLLREYMGYPRLERA